MKSGSFEMKMHTTCSIKCSTQDVAIALTNGEFIHIIFDIVHDSQSNSSTISFHFL